MRFQDRRRVGWSCLPWWLNLNRATFPMLIMTSIPTSFSQQLTFYANNSELNTQVNQTVFSFFYSPAVFQGFLDFGLELSVGPSI